MTPWRSRRCAELAAALLALGISREAAACPCGAPAGAFPAWTAMDERLTLSLVLGAAAEHGSFDDRGRAWPLPAGVSATRITSDLTVAWRASPAWELTASVAAAWSSVSLPGIAVEGIALGDSALRARWEGPRSLPRGAPMVALWTGVRAPTGDRDPRAQGLTSVGLGHWELSLGGELRWDLAARWTVSVGAELGVRAPARWEGVEMLPGPRGAVLLLAVWRPHDDVALSAGITGWAEVPAWIEGHQDDVPWSYRLGPTAGVIWQVTPALRLLASLGVDPRVDHLGANTSANVRGSLGLSWAALRD